MRKIIFPALALFFLPLATTASESYQLSENEYFETRGVNVLVFSNWYNGLFDDSKISGVELIHHGIRTATNGDVRLNATPEQWDPGPALKLPFLAESGNVSASTITAASGNMIRSLLGVAGLIGVLPGYLLNYAVQ